MIDQLATGRRPVSFPEAVWALTWAVGLSYVAGIHQAMSAGLDAYIGHLAPVPGGDAAPDGAEIIDIAEVRRLRAVR